MKKHNWAPGWVYEKESPILKCYNYAAFPRPVTIKTHTVRKMGFVTFMWLLVGNITTTATPEMISKVWDESEHCMPCVWRETALMTLYFVISCVLKITTKLLSITVQRYEIRGFRGCTVHFMSLWSKQRIVNTAVRYLLSVQADAYFMRLPAVICVHLHAR